MHAKCQKNVEMKTVNSHTDKFDVLASHALQHRKQSVCASLWHPLSMGPCEAS